MSVYEQRIVKRDPDVRPEGYNRFDYWDGAEKKFLALCNTINHGKESPKVKLAKVEAFAEEYPICLGFIRQLRFYLVLLADRTD
jgi:hypothetical protein